MNDYDQGSRFQVKGNADAHLAWLFPKAWKVMRFGRWLDSQSAPRPGEPDRRCDNIDLARSENGLGTARTAVAPPCYPAAPRFEPCLIWTSAIASQSRRPGYWAKRKPD